MDFQWLRADLKLPSLLDDNNLLKLLDAKAYDAISPDALRLWCNRYARYGLPTIELIEWLRKRIAGRDAIEIGSGTGDLAHHLGIPATDNRMQEWPEIKSNYEMMGQPVIKYPDFVQKLDALDAVKQYKPDIVIEIEAPRATVEKIYREERDPSKIKYLQKFRLLHQSYLNDYFNLVPQEERPIWITFNNNY